MAALLGESENGVGLAAPQIGISKAVFIVLKSVTEPQKSAGQKESETKKFTLDDILIFINPSIIKQSRKKESLHEGCLSVPGIFGNITRSRQVTLKALDENGKEIIRGAGGILAQVFQHECDHLNGKLFIDNATDLRKIEK